ncbi:hypothetical protein [Amycolatopsis sp. NPDC003731]
MNVRLFSNERDRDVVIDLIHEALLVFLGAATVLTGSGPAAAFATFRRSGRQ